jgi:hypothetical protein
MGQRNMAHLDTSRHSLFSMPGVRSSYEQVSSSSFGAHQAGQGTCLRPRGLTGDVDTSTQNAECDVLNASQILRPCYPILEYVAAIPTNATSEAAFSVRSS